MQSDQKQYTRRRGILGVLRVVLLVHGLAVMTQAVLAGQFLSGADAPVFFHAWTGWFVLGVSLVQIAAAIAFANFGGPLWLVISSLFVCIAEALQLVTGYTRFLAVHIPLGVFVFGAMVWMTLWAFRKHYA